MNRYTRDWYRDMVEQIYELTIRPIENVFKKVGKEILGNKIDLDKIVDGIEYEIGKSPGILGYVDLSEKEKGKEEEKKVKIYINMDALKDFYSSPGGRIKAYHAVIHELIHYSRSKIREQINGSYDKDIEDPFTEETITEAITTVFLSKIFGKETIEYINKKTIEKVWRNATPKYVYSNTVFYTYGGEESGLPYYLGITLGDLLLKMKKKEQKEYTERLFEINTRDDLKKLIYDLWNYIPKDEETIRYYNLVKNFVEGKAKVLYKE